MKERFDRIETWLLALLTFLLLACGPAKKAEPSPDQELYSALENRRKVYIQNIEQEESGFIDTAHCDSLLWSGLVSYGGLDVDIRAAEKSPGEWLRRPVSLPECYANGESRSTISRDMLLGVLYHTMKLEDAESLDILVPMYNYGKSHRWFMGEGRYNGADTFMPPAYIALLADLLIARGYSPADVQAYSLYPNNVDSDCVAYVCHVNVLRHYLRKMSGSSKDNEGLAKISARYPNNPLFLYAAGNKKAAINKLLELYDPAKPPFCEVWPLQENGGQTSWDRCTDGKDSGGGFLFLSKLILTERI